MATFLVGADAAIADDDNTGANFISLCNFLCAVTGNVTEIRVKCGGNVNVKVGIYDGITEELLGSNQVGQACVAGWNSIPVSAIPVVATEAYWLGLNSDQTLTRHKNAGVHTLYYKALPYANAWPDPLGAGWFDTPSEIAIAGWEVISGPPGVKTVQNVVAASIKTINEVGIASIKTLQDAAA